MRVCWDIVLNSDLYVEDFELRFDEDKASRLDIGEEHCKGSSHHRNPRVSEEISLAKLKCTGREN